MPAISRRRALAYALVLLAALSLAGTYARQASRYGSARVFLLDELPLMEEPVFLAVPATEEATGSESLPNPVSGLPGAVWVVA
jgi:hypothetical protein